MHEVRVAARPDFRLYPEGRGVGCFFSGGADSFHSVVENLDSITHLIFVRQGFDIGPDERTLATQSEVELRIAAAELGLELIVVDTDIRRLSNKYSSWGARYHGAALATVGILHSDHLRAVLIPSSHAPQQGSTPLHPWGSHPDLDPYWSTSSFQVVHHGNNAYRHEKLEIISGNDVAMRHLRVCWENPGQEYNCGRCEKCVRTMIELYACEALGACRTLPDRIDVETLARQRLEGHGVTFAARNAGLIESRIGKSDPVAQALRKSLALHAESQS